MSSTSPEDVLIGLMPDDITTVHIGAAEFDVGTIDVDEWARLNTALAVARQNSARENIRKLSSEGINPNEVVSELDGTPLTRLDLAVSSDPVFMKDVVNLYADAAVLSVRDHRKLVDRAHNPIPCVRVNGRLSEATARVYRVNTKIVHTLWPHIRRLNTLEEATKKVSQP